MSRVPQPVPVRCPWVLRGSVPAMGAGVTKSFLHLPCWKCLEGLLSLQSCQASTSPVPWHSLKSEASWIRGLWLGMRHRYPEPAEGSCVCESHLQWTVGQAGCCNKSWDSSAGVTESLQRVLTREQLWAHQAGFLHWGMRSHEDEMAARNPREEPDLNSSPHNR